MCEGHRRSYWTTGVPGWMRGGGRAWFGWGHRWHGPWHEHEHGHGHATCDCGPEWSGADPCECRSRRGEPTSEDEVAFLKEEAEALKHYGEGIERRIAELEKASAAHGSS